MSDNLSDLKLKVAHHFLEKAGYWSISWFCSMVGIQDILLNKPPSRWRGPMNTHIPEEEYQEILTNWERNRIGGEKKFYGGGDHAEWFPPKGTKIARIGGIHSNGDVFFVLYLNDRQVFLQQKQGERPDFLTGSREKPQLRAINGEEENTEEFIPSLKRVFETYPWDCEDL